MCGCAGTVTPQGRSPPSASVTPVFGGTEDLSELLRASPGIDFSKLQIKHEVVSLSIIIIQFTVRQGSTYTGRQ